MLLLDQKYAGASLVLFQLSYERWAKIFNLKEAAKTLNFLIENDLTDYDELAARAEQAGDRFDEVSHRIKQLEARMGEVAQLK